MKLATFRCRTLFTKGVDRQGEQQGGGLLPAVVVQIGQVKRLLLGWLPEKGRARCLLVKGSEADAEAVYLQATRPQDPFLRADAANRLLQLLRGDLALACQKSGLSPGQLNELLLLARLSAHERRLASLCGFSQRTLVQLAARDEVQRRRLLVVAANRKRICRETARRLDGRRCTGYRASSIKDERIVRNTLQNATDQICRAGFDASLMTRKVARGTQYSVLVAAPAAAGAAKGG